MEPRLSESKIERNEAIWYANRVKGVGAARLADQYGLSRQRIKEIIARQDQLQAGAVRATEAQAGGRREAHDHVS